MAADACTALAFSLSPGQARDAPEGRQLLNRLGRRRDSPALIRDRADAGGETRQRASALGCEPVGPPLRTRIQPGAYDRELDQRRNASERLLRRWQGFRRSFSQFEKLDGVCLGFIAFALIVDASR